MNNSQLLTDTTYEIGDAFSRLGGALRYPGMRESEIFLYIACQTLDQQTHSVLVEKYVEPQFMEAGKNAIAKANLHLSKISATDLELQALLTDYLAHYDNKLQKTREASSRWQEFFTVL